MYCISCFVLYGLLAACMTAALCQLLKLMPLRTLMSILVLNKIMFVRTRSLYNAFQKFTVYVRINIITD